MSGLEVVGLVAGIVSAFAGAGSLFRNWRRDRKERRRQEKNRHLEQALIKGSSDVQKTYDDDFRRLGPVFARGDGRTPPTSISSPFANAMLFFAEIGRGTLAEQLIKLQGTVISILTGTTPISALVYPNHDLLSDTSIAVRLRSLSALADQYQRMSQAAPISAPPAARATKDCDGIMNFSPDSMSDDIDWWECSSCNWKNNFWKPKHPLCSRTYLEYFHVKGNSYLRRCALCDVRPLSSGPELTKHLKDAHGFDGEKERQNNKDGCIHHRLAAYLRAAESQQTAD